MPEKLRVATERIRTEWGSYDQIIFNDTLRCKGQEWSWEDLIGWTIVDVEFEPDDNLPILTLEKSTL